MSTCLITATLYKYPSHSSYIIEISAANFGSGLSVGLLSQEQFTLGSSASTPDHRFLYDNTNGGLYFDPDGNGAIIPVQFASLTANLNLTYNNFEIVA